ncbi:MAG TPA: tRNA (adenosine(37)-N6)-threonylcarbamoyltransferase complex dimerization subunit type 1 TsaB [Candidatus Dormibacteraeota bacterium]|jgi:tRNA threonylcarbamoyl adenosine modification protein YeaZ|nr:tRNA (adenosine(37)-N6)-threonylcarbamoyltransferase complex dimerization subunit type 1 TsaB [Candidatus Dormibacteraeota bacterium]
MTILALDTSSRRRALVLLADPDGTVRAARPLTGRDLDRELPPALAALLAIANPGAVACVMGPGSYTGLRVGIATALGLAHARDLPLHGIPALDVVARAARADTAGTRDIEAVAEAGRGALYVARYRRDGTVLTLLDPPRRVESGGWQPHDGAEPVSIDSILGTHDGSARAAEALAQAAVEAATAPPLPRSGLEPVYLHGSVSTSPGPRV